MADLVLNARFMMRPTTGVDRVAMELIGALDALGLPDGVQDWRALRPAGPTGANDMASTLRSRTEVSTSRLDGHLWEQLVLGHTAPNDWLMSLCNIGPVLRQRQIVMIHDAQVFRTPESYSRAFRLWYHAMQPQLGRRAAMVLTVSEHAKAELEHFGVVPPGKARVVPNGADHILRTPADCRVLRGNRLRKGSYFLAIGSMATHKNLPMIAKAASYNGNSETPLVIAGGGDRSVFADSGIAETGCVRPIGRVTDGELRALYENATALVFPSLTEGFGLPPLEAMLCGCPVIASTGGAIPEVCGDAALFVDPMNMWSWASAMTLLNQDPGLRGTLSQIGYKRAAAFTWANAAAILKGHLSQLPQTSMAMS